ncbi:MAG: hypothetical protein ACK5MB_12150 [Phycisphaerales bacterium]|jgi:hypothetical protein
MATAELITATGKAPSLRRTTDGYVGRKIYRVLGADDLDAVYAATGMPAMFDAFSAGAGALSLLQSMDPQYIGGVSPNRQWEVTCDFAPPTIGAARRRAIANTAFCEEDVEKDSVIIYQPWRPDTGAPTSARPLANGQGVPREISRRIIRVTVFRSPSWYATNNNTILSYLDSVNANTIAVPRPYGISGKQNYNAGKLRFRGIRAPEVVDGVLRFVLEFVAAEDHLVRWAPENSSGVLDWSVGLVSAKIYPEISWDAGVLFP